MRRELSSRYTFAYRWIIPGVLTLAAIFVVWRFARIGMPEHPDTLRVLAGVVIAVTLMVVARFFDKAKRVWIDDETLIISAYGRETQIDFGEVERVTISRFIKSDRIQLHFRRPTIYGDKIVFFPPFRVRRRHMGAHPVFTELADLVNSTDDPIE